MVRASLFAVIHSRPQDAGTPLQDAEPSVELEKQPIVEVTPNLRKYVDQFPHPTQRNIDDSTKEILEKIAQVNKKQGLIPRKQKPSYFQFPFSYSRSQEQEKFNIRERSFSSSPFSNPILEYLLRTKDKDEETNTKAESSEDPSDDYDEDVGYEKSVSGADVPGVNKEDVVPGQYIKRKVVHQQTFAIPMPNMNPSPPQNIPSNMFPNFPQMLPPPSNENKDKPNVSGDRKTLSSLEKQTVDNVKSIVSTTQMLQSQAYPGLYYNPYLQVTPDQYQYRGIPSNDDYSYRVYGPFTLPSSEKARQNWNWPGANYFPIYIRDPFLQFYNAITTMIEYGPNAGQGGPCKRPNKIKGKQERLTREGKLANQEKEHIVVEMGDRASGQITIYGPGDEDKNSSSYLDIENIDIGGSRDSGLKFTVSLTAGEREAKGSEDKVAVKTAWDKTRDVGIYNTSRSTSKLEKFAESPKDIRPPPFIKPVVKPVNATPTRLPPQSPPTIHVEEVDDEFDDDDEKSEEISISNDGNKKMFSRDNTGSGIFIHKLKVRKGGVAIAGPGGIATAGSGGTAIVGPNGVAFTQPDSLAIAGSGTKVVAVDPTINLADLINSTSLANKTGSGFPPSRVGRVVAVGPVIYYNKGLITSSNGLRFPKWLPHPHHQSQYFGDLHHPFDPKSNTTHHKSFNPSPSSVTSSSSRYYHFPRYLQNPETLTIHGSTLQIQPTTERTKADGLDLQKTSNRSLEVNETVTAKPVIASVKEEIKISDILKQTSLRLEGIDSNALNDMDSLAPYRAHPLFHYLKNKNTIQKQKIISFRNEDGIKNDVTTLILKPVARAIAGVEGKAVSTPVSKAILRPGTNVDILFEPEAVAIAGAGGIAHAESNLEITYEDFI
ncbi:hypothetical protein NQ315_008111 [Exocentrus adspersus]|uniref:DUF4774 domain-containing protein n=1 Tax=Exocentrus adspersus TaxID=1586481 RepID=A0AAV8VW06_9CUCU|nr:hypothetical protein NQ315_008111 [Exocentrus adspersus]